MKPCIFTKMLLYILMNKNPIYTLNNVPLRNVSLNKDH